MTDSLKQILKRVTPPAKQTVAADPLVGTRLNNEYQILELLGQGAMARVYKARQITLDRTVAIKILTTESPDLVARFIHEIKVHSLLKHANVVEALDCVTDTRTGQTCFVMEYLDGASLQQVVRAHPDGMTSEEDIYYVISQVANALNYAHRQGVIHRDLKPANLVFVEYHDQLQVKVVDFGMARLQEQLQRFTKTGHIVGSPLYMSPEQCLGKELDARSDVYALGLVTYEMATGKAPFANAASLYDVMQSHCDPDKMPEPISVKNPNLRLNERLYSIVKTAMATNPDRRFQNVKLFEDALRGWYDGVKKGLTPDEINLTPIESGFVSDPLQEVDTSKSIDNLPSLIKRSQQAHIAPPRPAVDGGLAKSVNARKASPGAFPSSSAIGAPSGSMTASPRAEASGAAVQPAGLPATPSDAGAASSTSAPYVVSGPAPARGTETPSVAGSVHTDCAATTSSSSGSPSALSDPSSQSDVPPETMAVHSTTTQGPASAGVAIPLVRAEEERAAKASWRIPEMVTTNHGGGWGVVDGQELSYIRQSEPMVGRLLNNRYRVQELIGEGGMSVVYRAEDRETKKMVAVKSLKFVDAELAERFSREINLHMELKHPNIVKAMERISTVNQTFFVMELLSGTVLEDYLEREFRITSFNDICTILSQICDALEFAHDQDVIHRDLKPGNVMLVDQGGNLRVKVLDFGLAQIQDEMQRLTRTGILVGSPGYMSPEHCLGQSLTCQSDIYSFGVLAFEVIAGELPFVADSDIAVLRAHCDMSLRALPISQFRPDLPAVEELEKVLALALEKNQAVRYQAIADFRRGLHGWWLATGAAADESPFKERRRRRRKIRSVTGMPAAAAAAASPRLSHSGMSSAAPVVAESEDLSSLVEKQRQSQAENATARFRDDSRFANQNGPDMVKMVLITILIFCVMGTFVWFSMQNRGSDHTADVPPVSKVEETKPAEKSPKMFIENSFGLPSAETLPRTTDPNLPAAEIPVQPDEEEPEPTTPKRKLKIIGPGQYR